MWLIALWLFACTGKDDTDGTVDTDTDTDTDDVVGGVLGDPCTQNADCQGALVCASTGECAELGSPGTVGFGDECVSTASCQASLVCLHQGVCDVDGVKGSADTGRFCEADDDCRRGLQCWDDTCQGLEPPLYPGVSCPEQFEQGNYEMLFDLDSIDTEFFRAPFPLHGRQVAGHPLRGPVQEPVGLDISEALTGRLEPSMGFGNHSVVTMRFSSEPEWSTFGRVGKLTDGLEVQFVDLTEGSTFGFYHPTSVTALPLEEHMTCGHWLTLGPVSGRPFVPGHTYAAVLGTGLTNQANVNLAPSTTMASLLNTAAPADGSLSDLWQAYEPLRQWITNEGLSGRVGAAVVFTVQDPWERMTALAQAVDDAAVPTFSSLHLCQGGQPGPLLDPTDPTTGCGPSSTLYDEIHGLVELTQFVEGQAPYKTPADGGSVSWLNGVPQSQGTAAVPFALTLPSGPMPASGWPVIIAMADGNRRWFMEQGIAEWQTEVSVSATDARFAIVAIDPVYGARLRAEVTQNDPWIGLDPGAFLPSVLLNSPLNPEASQALRFQAAAELLQLVRIGEQTWAPQNSPTGSEVRFDSSAVYVMAEGEAAWSVVAAAPFSDRIHAFSVANAGAETTLRWTESEEPYDLGQLSGMLVPELSVDNHPMTALAQTSFDWVDPAVFGRALIADPPSQRTHFMQLYDVDSQSIGSASQYALARSGYAGQLTGSLPPLSKLTELTAPVTNNSFGATAVVRLLSTGGTQSVWQLPEVQAEVSLFFGTAHVNGTPTVVLTQ